MPKKLYSWRGRPTTLRKGDQTYSGKVVLVHRAYDPNNRYFFETEDKRLIRISASGTNRVICKEGGLVVKSTCP